jgi:hypothetical protein
VSEAYSLGDGTELWLRYGSNHSQQIIIIAPLFEEANRCRKLLADVMRGLASHRIGSVLPDLPGTGESSVDISNVAFSDWHETLLAVVETIKPVVIASLRGGALLDGGIAAKGYWRFAPETGARIVRDLKRTQLGGGTLYAGHAISDDFLAALEDTAPAALSPLRTLRLEGDAGEADAKLAGSPLWRRAEPGDDPALAAALVADLTEWVKICAAS